MSETGYLQFRDRHGREVHTRFQRAGRGEVVVMIHGVGAQASIWKPQFDELSTAFDVLAYDLMGHGESSLPPAATELRQYADQLLALLDQLQIPHVHLIGHSMGALIGLEFALSHPERTRSVVAMNAVFCRTPEQRTAVQERAATFERRMQIDWDGTITRWFGDPIPDASAAAASIMRKLLNAVDPTGYARTYRLFATADTAHRERLASLQVPALFVTGENDPNSTPTMSHAMATLAPRGRALVIAGERHMMSLTAAVQINQVLIDFLLGVGRDVQPGAGSVGPGSCARVDRIALRKALGSFVTGVTIVASRQADGQPRGFTANSFTSVSLDPPLILVCISKTAASHTVFVTAGHFGVSVLAENQTELSSLFASKAADKFARVAWREGPAGSPIIDGAAAWFDCTSENLVDAGDHVILIGRVVAFDHAPTNPLGYYRGAHVTFGLSLDALAASGNRTSVGAILERAASIVLIASDDGSYDLPVGTALGEATDPQSLSGRMQHLGIKATLSFLFAVFENPQRGRGAISIYYRGALDDPLSEDRRVRLVPFDAIPWSQLADDAVRSMLRRYVRERSEDTFGIYVGDSERGTVQMIAPSTTPRPWGNAS